MGKMEREERERDKTSFVQARKVATYTVWVFTIDPLYPIP